MTRNDFTHWVDVPVRWGDVDRLGHVNNVQYFRYSEEARTQWIDAVTAELELPNLWEQEGIILAEIQCHFRQQLHHPATVSIGTRVLRIGNSSLQLRQGFFTGADDRLVATSDARIVWFDYAGQRSAPLPDAVRARIRQMETIAPEEN